MKDLKAYVLLGSLLLGVYFVAQYYKPKPVDWRQTFSRKDKIPFGTYILYERLNDIFPGATLSAHQQAPYLTITENELKPGAYIIIAHSLKLDQYDFEKLKTYMEGGNDVFIATYFLGQFFGDSLKTRISSELYPSAKKKSALHFVNPQLEPSKKYVFDRDIGNQYFSSFDTSRAVVLGKNHRGHANFIRYAFGKGNLYIISSPFFFTNYNILKPGGAEYAERALSYVRASDEIVWDDFSALGANVNTSPMRVFLKHKELKWAYYIALFSLVFFVLYEVKRRQRIIPVIEPLKNSTIEFVRVVGQVYYQQRNNANIAQKKVVYLLEEIRTRYNIKTNDIDAAFTDILIRKSGISTELATNLVTMIGLVKRYNKISDAELIELNKYIELFHKQSR